VGAILTGVLAQKIANEAGSGVIDGNTGQLQVQLIATLATAAYSVVVTFVILIVVKALVGLRVAELEESEGLDLTQHGEQGYSS
jgi:Amt family ammonium transporter